MNASGMNASAMLRTDAAGRDRILLVAAGVTFFLLLAMVPALTALVSIYGLFTDPASVEQHLSIIQRVLPEGGQAIVGEQLGRLSEQANTSLGFALAASLAFALWSANAGVKAMFEGMNVAYNEDEKRGFVKRTLLSLAFTVGGILLLLAMIAVTIVLPIAVSLIGLGSQAGWIIRIGSVLVLAVAAMTALAALYRWGPSREEAQWKWITPGAVAAVVIAGLASFLFSWYVGNFGSYNETYGSLGALIGFMTWMWIMVIVVLMGAELNAEVERQTARDSARQST